jgi:hypothetical protein
MLKDGGFECLAPMMQQGGFCAQVSCTFNRFISHSGRRMQHADFAAIPVTGA